MDQDGGDKSLKVLKKMFAYNTLSEPSHIWKKFHNQIVDFNVIYFDIDINPNHLLLRLFSTLSK